MKTTRNISIICLFREPVPWHICSTHEKWKKRNKTQIHMCPLAEVAFFFHFSLANVIANVRKFFVDFLLLSVRSIASDSGCNNAHTEHPFIYYSAFSSTSTVRVRVTSSGQINIWTSLLILNHFQYVMLFSTIAYECQCIPYILMPMAAVGRIVCL